MDILDTARKQYCVYWPPGGLDDFNNPTYGTPKNLRVRWDASTEVIKTKSGSDYTSRARVMVGEDVVEEGVLWLGPGHGLSTTDPLGGLDTEHRNKPFKNAGAYPIMRFDSSPTVDAASDADFYRVAFL